jgi:hypothetical protein
MMIWEKIGRKVSRDQGTGMIMGAMGREKSLGSVKNIFMLG